jgi:N-acetylgalactosamine-N,N'-diacetylbacillosaminyl-diphospho-undecaprenol 4-alpha-N-acetylgalactosaminyltransferase
MINQNHTYKIALVGDCLANGGAEKVHTLLSVYFQEQGMEVHNCIFVDWVSYDYLGSLFNLGIINPDANFIKRKITRFFAFKKFIKENNFDVVIDFRMRTSFLQEFLLSIFCYSKNTYYTVHSGILEYYFPKNSWLSKLIYQNKNIVAVSRAIQKIIIEKGILKQVDQIYNPIDLKAISQLQTEYLGTEENYILAVGRMNEGVKQFDLLIQAYSKSELPAKKIKLVFLGEGTNRSKYESIATELGVKDLVVFKGFVENPFPYYQKALFTVLSSKNEGFPNVILESFAVATPVISFDCFSGPNEIIIDHHNGLLVANQDFDKLTDAMNLIVSDIQLYEFCKQNAKESLTLFDIQIIGKQWLELFKNKVS